MKRIADSGLLIAALDRGDAHHAWARSRLESEPPPWLVCEPVLAEIAASIGTARPVLEMLAADDLEIAFEMKVHQKDLLAMVTKYKDQNMDLADACVVKMSELFGDSTVYTVDAKDFSIYRRHGNHPVRRVCPE